MTIVTRRSVLAALGLGLATAGCVGDPGETGTDESTTDAGTTTDYRTGQASGQQDPDHRISVNNDADEARTARTWVVREETGETVFEATRGVPAGAEVEVYNLKEADPDGIETFRVCGQLVDSAGGTATTTTTATTASEESDSRGCATLQTSECYGEAIVTVEKDDSLAVIYAIC
jgi:hypothetical protein